MRSDGQTRAVAEKRVPPPMPETMEKRERRVFPALSAKEVVDRITKKCAPSTPEIFGTGQDKVIFLPSATKELYAMIYWGERTPTNCFEQLYQGIGHIFEKDGARTIVISHFLYIYAAERTSVSACITKGSLDSMMPRIEYEREVYNRNEKKCNRSKQGYLFDPFVEQFGPSEPVLYGHTHPDLGVFFSRDDHTSGFATPDLPAVTFVADPIKKDMLAMDGVEKRPAQVIVFQHDGEGYREKKPTEATNVQTSEITVIDTRPQKTHTAEEIETVLSEIGKNCNDLLSPLNNVKGKYRSNRTITGAVHIRADLTWKPDKKAAKLEKAAQTKKAGARYESYA